MRLPFLLFTLLLSLTVYGQSETSFRAMWYNVENLFDTNDDPGEGDNEFLPSGTRRWTHKRYYNKLKQLAKVIQAVGEWDTPALIGMCEVENDTVLTHLVRRTPLRNRHYRYCMTTGSDPRGIHVALLYQRDKFAYIGHTSYPIHFRTKASKPTRDILHVWGVIGSRDTLDVLLCHFPSRYGGEKESEPNRMQAVLTLQHLCDSLHAQRLNAQLLIMGDFNDTPSDKSMQRLMRQATDSTTSSLTLQNLYADPKRFNVPGTNKYQGIWSQLDQILISKNLLNPENGFRLLPSSPTIFAPDFLLTEDKTWQGKRLKRTYYGYKYEGGFSDHLPLVVDFLVRNKKTL